jgi:hypothetical protein
MVILRLSALERLSGASLEGEIDPAGFTAFAWPGQNGFVAWGNCVVRLHPRKEKPGGSDPAGLRKICEAG